jgi:hypothetical protein
MSDEPRTLRIDGDDKTIVHVTWGRSGKRALITVATPQFTNPRQAVLTVEQAADLGRFLSDGPDATR